MERPCDLALIVGVSEILVINIQFCLVNPSIPVGENYIYIYIYIYILLYYIISNIILVYIYIYIHIVIYIIYIYRYIYISLSLSIYIYISKIYYRKLFFPANFPVLGKTAVLPLSHTWWRTTHHQVWFGQSLLTKSRSGKATTCKQVIFLGETHEYSNLESSH